MILNNIKNAFIGNDHVKKIMMSEAVIWPTKPEVDEYSCLLIDGAVASSGHKGSFLFQTDYVPNLNTRIEMYYQYTKGSGDVWYSLFKCNANDNLGDMGGRVPYGTRWQVGCWGNSRSVEFRETGTNPSLGRFKLIMDKDKAILETPSGVVFEKSFSGNPTLIDLSATPLHIGSWRIRSTVPFERSALGYYGVIRIYEGDTLMREYIPYVDNNGVACYYDTVNKKEMYLETASVLTVTKTQWAH